VEKRKFNLSGIFAFIIAALVLVAVVPVNIIFNYYDKDFDMTEKSKYTFTDTTLQLLEETKDKEIEIYFLYDFDALRDTSEFLALYYTLEQLDARDNITLTCFMPDEKPDLIKLLNPSGALNPGQADVFVKCGDTIKQVASSRIFPYDSNGATSYAGEELISGAIKIVTGGSLPTIYFLTGHGEKTIDDGYATFAQVLKSGSYDAQSLDLSTVDAVPDNASIVMLAGPQTDITKEEKEKLEAYADKGGSFAFFIPPVETEGRFTNIEKFLEGYEIGIDYNRIEETAPSRMLNNRDYKQDPAFFMCTYTAATDSFTVDLTSEINSLAESQGLIPGISNTRSLYQILDTGSAYIEKSSIITNSPDELGAYSTLSIPFGGDDETAEEAEKLSDIQLELGFYSYNKENGSKLIALGTTDVMDEDTISVAVSLTQQLVKNSITWLYNSDMNMNIGNKDTAYDYLAFPNAEKAESTLRIFTIVPFCIAALGLLVWLKRRNS